MISIPVKIAVCPVKRPVPRKRFKAKFIRKKTLVLTGYQPELVSTADIVAISRWNWISITAKKQELKAGMSGQSWSGTADSVDLHVHWEDCDWGTLSS